MRTPLTPISGKSPHLYVTRAATLTYQRLTGSPFETAKKALTLRILSGARVDPENNGCYLVAAQLPSGPQTLRIWTQREGQLLIIPKIAAVRVDAAY